MPWGPHDALATVALMLALGAFVHSAVVLSKAMNQESYFGGTLNPFSSQLLVMDNPPEGGTGRWRWRSLTDDHTAEGYAAMERSAPPLDLVLSDFFFGPREPASAGGRLPYDVRVLMEFSTVPSLSLSIEGIDRMRPGSIVVEAEEAGRPVLGPPPRGAVLEELGPGWAEAGRSDDTFTVPSTEAYEPAEDLLPHVVRFTTSAGLECAVALTTEPGPPSGDGSEPPPSADRPDETHTRITIYVRGLAADVSRVDLEDMVLDLPADTRASRVDRVSAYAGVVARAADRWKLE